MREARPYELSGAETPTELKQYLEFRAWERRALRRGAHIAGWFALVPTCAATAWLWDGGEPGRSLLALPLFFPAFFVAAAFVLAAFRWTLEAAAGAWDLFFGED